MRNLGYWWRYSQQETQWFLRIWSERLQGRKESPHGTIYHVCHLTFWWNLSKSLWHKVLTQENKGYVKDIVHYWREFECQEFSYYLLYNFPLLPKEIENSKFYNFVQGDKHNVSFKSIIKGLVCSIFFGMFLGWISAWITAIHLVSCCDTHIDSKDQSSVTYPLLAVCHAWANSCNGSMKPWRNCCLPSFCLPWMPSNLCGWSFIERSNEEQSNWKKPGKTTNKWLAIDIFLHTMITHC